MLYSLKTACIEAEEITLAGESYVFIKRTQWDELFDQLPEPQPVKPRLVRKKKRQTVGTLAALPAAKPVEGEATDKEPTFCDVLRATLASIGPATIQQIEENLQESGLPHKPGKVASYLSYLRKRGDAVKVGEEWRAA
jgi:hypothetical protein